MAVFGFARRTPLSADEAWVRLTDWERHGDFIPLTEVTLAGLIRDDTGAAFVARTSLGPFHFDDPMEVTSWHPPADGEPGLCRIVKRGRVVTGWALLTVTPTTDGSAVSWREEARFRLAGPLLDIPSQIAGRKIFARLVDGLLADGVSGDTSSS